MATLESDLAACNLEHCPICGCWCEAGEMVDENGDTVGCLDWRDVTVTIEGRILLFSLSLLNYSLINSYSILLLINVFVQIFIFTVKRA